MYSKFSILAIAYEKVTSLICTITSYCNRAKSGYPQDALIIVEAMKKKLKEIEL